MTIKIITWINTGESQFKRQGWFHIEPVDYNGEKIVGIEVRDIDKEYYENFMESNPTQTWNRGRNRVKFELEESQMEIDRNHSGGIFLKLRNKVTFNQWSPPSKFRVKVTDRRKGITQFNDNRVDITIEDKQREKLIPETKKLEIKFKNEGERDNYLNNIKIGTEYFVSNVNWDDIKWTGTAGDKKLNLNYNGWKIPAMDDVNQTQTTTNPTKEAAVKKVDEIIKRANSIISIISNHTTATKDNLTEAEKVLQELKNIKNNGNSEEKKALEGWGEEEYTTKFENKINVLRGHLNLKDIPSSKIPTNSNETNNLNSEENGETARKYKELRGKIFDRTEDYQKYANVNSTLLNEINEKEEKLGVFWSIESGDKEDYKKRAQQHNNGVSTRMKELVGLMERLIAEEAAKGNNKKRGREGDENLPEAKRPKSEEDEVKQNIAKSRHENREKSKEKDDKLTSLIREAQQKNNYEELANILKQIDEFEGEQVYQDRQQDIQELKTKLAGFDINKFREKVKNDLESKLKNNNIDENNLSSEMKGKLEKIRKGEISDVNEIITFEKEFSEKVGDESANNKLDSLITKAQSLIGKVRNGVQVLKKELEEVLEEMIKFVSSTNVHEQKSYSEKAEKVNNMLVELKKSQSSAALENQKGIAPWKIIVPVSVGLVALAAIIIMIRNRRIKKAQAKSIE